MSQLYGMGGYNQYNTTIPTNGLGSQYNDMQSGINGLYTAKSPHLGDMFMSPYLRGRMSSNQTHEQNRLIDDSGRAANWQNAGQLNGQLFAGNQQLMSQQLGQASQMGNAYNNLATSGQAGNWQNQMHAMQGGMQNIGQRLNMFSPFLSQAFAQLTPA